LKDIDCISNVCIAQHCSEPGPTFSQPLPPPATDASADAMESTGDAAGGDAAADR
jgi:hypothetical protein